MTPSQCRAGRALVGLTQERLAGRAGLDRKSLIHFEAERRVMLPAHARAVREALEAAGVVFIDGDRPGVRMATRKAA